MTIKNDMKDLSKFSKERVIEILKCALQSPLEPSPFDTYGISLQSRLKDAIKTIKKLK